MEKPIFTSSTLFRKSMRENKQQTPHQFLSSVDSYSQMEETRAGRTHRLAYLLVCWESQSQSRLAGLFLTFLIASHWQSPEHSFIFATRSHKTVDQSEQCCLLTVRTKPSSVSPTPLFFITVLARWYYNMERDN